MGTPTYEPIATTTLTSAAASITFSGIANTWTDLRLVLTYAGETGNVAAYIRLNGDSGSNYSFTWLAGNGSSAASGGSTNQTYIGNAYAYASATVPALYEMDIQSYAAAIYKSCLINHSSDRNGAGAKELHAATYRSTSAITSLTAFTSSGNFATGTKATIWGLKAA